MGIGLRFSPELVVLSPLSLALLSLMREARLSRRVRPRSESTERFAPWPALTAFLRCRGPAVCAGAGTGLVLFFFEGERLKRGSQEFECDEPSTREPRVDDDQRERRGRSDGTSETVDGEREMVEAHSSAAAASSRWLRTWLTSTSKSNEDSGEVGGEYSDICE